MTESLVNFVYVLVSIYSNYVIVPYPMWKTLGVNKYGVFTFFTVLTLYISAGYFIAALFLEMDYQALHFFNLCINLPVLLATLWLFRRRAWQTVFLISTAFMYSTVSSGSASYISINWLADFKYPTLATSLLTLVIAIFTLPPLLNILRRLCLNPDIQEARVWKFIWLLPAAFFTMLMLAGSSFLITGSPNIGFLIVRIFVYGALLLTCHLLDLSLRQVSENISLKERARMMEGQLSMQREHYARLTANTEQVKTMHHDIRHHLAVIGQLAEEEKAGKVRGYVEELTGKLSSTSEKSYCINHVVNVVAAHYLGLAESEGITTEAQLKIPEDTGQVPAMDLCVILGNFLENALEACRRQVNSGSAGRYADDRRGASRIGSCAKPLVRVVSSSEDPLGGQERGGPSPAMGRFIRVRSREDGDTIAIVVTNSFDGVWSERDGAYLSRKEPAREGVGLPSVRSVCENHRGLVQFEVKENVWKSSALVHIR